MLRELRASLVITKNDIKVFYLRPPVILFGFAFPLFLFLSYSIGRGLPFEKLIPAWASISIFFASSNVAPASIPSERRIKTWERLLVAPITLTSILLGKALASMIFGVIIVSPPLLAGMMLLKAEISNPTLMLASIILSSITFSLFGLIFAAIPSEYPGEVMTPLNFIRLPLLFISGVFIPLNKLPYWARIISFLSPLTYSCDLFRSAANFNPYFNPALNIAALIFFAALFLAVSVKLHERTRWKD